MKSISKLKSERIKLTWSQRWLLIKRTFVEFFQENSFFHGAALAYYTIFAIVPILYLALTSFGAILGHDAIVQLIDKLLQEQIGIADSSGILSFLEDVEFEKSNPWLNFIGVVVLLISSSAVIASLRTSINEFYNVEIKLVNKKTQFFHSIFTRLISIFMLTVIGLSIVVLYTGETVFMSLSGKLYASMGIQSTWSLTMLENAFTIGINTVIFALVFKYIHDGKVLWRLAFSGGFLTSSFLFVGQLGLKYYLFNFFFGSKMGIAGSILIILAWVYYSSQIIFLGAKFIKVFSDIIGKPITFEVHKLLRRAGGE